MTTFKKLPSSPSVPVPLAQPALPELPPVPDTDMSVAGEEDPGAALDLVGGGAAATPQGGTTRSDPGADVEAPRARAQGDALQ